MSDFMAKMHQNRFRLGLSHDFFALDLSASSFWQSWLRAWMSNNHEYTARSYWRQIASLTQRAAA